MNGGMRRRWGMICDYAPFLRPFVEWIPDRSRNAFAARRPVDRGRPNSGQLSLTRRLSIASVAECIFGVIAASRQADAAAASTFNELYAPYP